MKEGLKKVGNKKGARYPKQINSSRYTLNCPKTQPGIIK
jgi:hypothetical protein